MEKGQPYAIAAAIIVAGLIIAAAILVVGQPNQVGRFAFGEGTNAVVMYRSRFIGQVDGLIRPPFS